MMPQRGPDAAGGGEAVRDARVTAHHLARAGAARSANPSSNLTTRTTAEMAPISSTSAEEAAGAPTAASLPSLLGEGGAGVRSAGGVWPGVAMSAVVLVGMALG